MLLFTLSIHAQDVQVPANLFGVDHLPFLKHDRYVHTYIRTYMARIDPSFRVSRYMRLAIISVYASIRVQ